MDGGRSFTLPLSEVTVSDGDEDIVEIVCPSDAIVEIDEAHFTAAASETAMQAAFAWVKGNTTSGNGSSVTPNPNQTGDAAFGGTCERNGTTVASGGSPVTLPCDGFDVRAGFHWTPTPRQRIILSPGERLCLRQLTGPGASYVGSGYIGFREIGG